MTGQKKKVIWMEVNQEKILVERKKIKNMYLRITKPEGIIKITAPFSMPQKTIEEFVRAKWSWIEATKEHFEKQMESQISEEEWTVRKEEYRKYLQQVLPEVIDKCEKITGLHAEEWRLRDMKTRWGSCNVVKKRIWLNIQLAAYPRECLEYVVIHELTHLLERGHNQVFWGYMDEFCPDWRQIRKELNRRR